MLEQGSIAFDAVGAERARLSVEDMLAKFSVSATRREPERQKTRI